MQQLQPNSGGFHSLATVASVAILASLGLTFVLDRYRDKQDKYLREEVKDRVAKSIEDQARKLNEVETRQNKLEAMLLKGDEIE